MFSIVTYMRQTVVCGNLVVIYRQKILAVLYFDINITAITFYNYAMDCSSTVHMTTVCKMQRKMRCLVNILNN